MVRADEQKGRTHRDRTRAIFGYMPRYKIEIVARRSHCSRMVDWPGLVSDDAAKPWMTRPCDECSARH